MMNVKYLDLQEFLRSKVSSATAQRQSLALAVGVAISRLTPIPTSPVEDGEAQFDMGLVHVADQYLSSFNENIVIDIDAARAAARAFWISRYRQVHDTADSLIIPRTAGGFTDRLTSLSLYVTPETLAYLDSNAEVIIVMINRVQSLLKETVTIG